MPALRSWSCGEPVAWQPSLLRRTWQLSESHPLQCRQQLATELRDGVGSSTNRNAGEDPSGLLPSELTAAPPKG